MEGVSREIERDEGSGGTADALCDGADVFHDAHDLVFLPAQFYPVAYSVGGLCLGVTVFCAG